ncbi:DNA-binding XRE family transcriptional regulator [Chitinophaga polysaccharea]|uniref:DNA-binding XRE family transcriptional regulator n=1 Tax=Chitinophaga polysaccharea TaxID=1293035 RepID=A0A561PN82_9BACT|nr:helix-turn-helix transcriptional regulator [Chitinophaga polysaccharea]TWF39566.1 DNA-binding XRE family transcriptional regulator [Chitinophaga polysaccharea]
MTFGQRVTFVRREKKLTQAQLGAAIGTTGDMVGKYERDAIKPSIEVAAKIADALDSTLDYLIRDIQNVDKKENSISPALIEHFNKIEKLSYKDREHVLAVIDAFTAKLKIQSIME